jgi:hypothetical protein
MKMFTMIDDKVKGVPVLELGTTRRHIGEWRCNFKHS